MPFRRKRDHPAARVSICMWWRWAVRSLPEYRMFRDEAARDRALRDIGHRVDGLGLFGIGAFGLGWHLLAPAPSWIRSGFLVLGPVVVLVGMIAVMRMLARMRLRSAAHQSGIPICPKCGYDLAGTPSQPSCPECGSEV